MRVAGWLLRCIGLLASLVAAPAFAALSTAFTYQGQLQQGMTPASGSCDFQFSLFDAANGGTQVGSTQSPSGVSVTNGLFTVQLDFGTNAFGDHDRWLQMAVRCPAGAGSFSTLLPRQQVTAAPNALYARAAGNANDLACSGCVSSSDLANASISATQLGDNVINSLKIADGTVAPADVGFNYAGSSSKGGAANDLACSNCVGSTEIIGGAVGQVLTTTGVGVAWQNPSPAGAGWSLTGNAGTNGATNFLGTSDNQALEVKVNGGRALRVEPVTIVPGFPETPNLVGGYFQNSAKANTEGNVIGGGGGDGLDGPNRTYSHYSTIAGGAGNQVGADTINPFDGAYATVGGGHGNVAGDDHTTVAGGFRNSATSPEATVAGGGDNTATSQGATVGGGVGNHSTGAYSTVGGGSTNSATGAYATIAGGGPTDPIHFGDTVNRATGDYATIGGGGGNLAGSFAVVAGGSTNTAEGASFVGGGTSNQALGASAIAGGEQNLANGSYVAIGGGFSNSVSGNYAAAAGGFRNTIGELGMFATIGGGANNQATAAYVTIGGGGETIPGDISTANRATDNYATIGGGGSNRAGNGTGSIDDAVYATIAGGGANTAGASGATIGGGLVNSATAVYATAAGGLGNTAGAPYAVVGGGTNNVASADFATVPGGSACTAAGASSFAAGSSAKANHNGAFVWADRGAVSTFESTAENQFSVRATGGVRFVSGLDGGGNPIGVGLANGAGSWSSLSDRAAKANVSSVDGVAILQQLVQIPIHTWNYQTQAASTRHIGPMAQDFYAAFQVGEDDRHITTIDADGVALAAIQGLHQIVQRKEAEISEQRQQIAALEQRLQAVEAVLTRDRKPARSLSGASAGWWPLVGFLALGILFRDRWGSGPR